MRGLLDIGEVAQRSGVAVSALRYYEKKGVIESIGRHGLRRQYKDDVLLRLSIVALSLQAGFSLEETAKMFPPRGKVKIDRKKLLQKAAEVDLAIARLRSVRDALKHVAHCPKEDQLDCPQFQRIIRIAGKKRRTFKKSL